MAYAERLRLTVRHAYHDPAPPPLRLVPLDLAPRPRILVRVRGPELRLLVEDDARAPDRLDLEVRAEAPELIAMTALDRRDGVPVLALPGDGQASAVDCVSGHRKIALRPPLAILEVDVPQEVARLELRFDAVETLWAYHLTGHAPSDAMQVADPAGAVIFDSLGTETLPDGRAVRTFRSARPLPARARSAARFALTETGPFGERTLIPVLPAPGAGLRILETGGREPRLQSDIYVNLW